MRELYCETLAQIVWAESAGFESVQVSEHHVTDEGYLPSVFPFLAAIAAQTTTIRLGSAAAARTLPSPAPPRRGRRVRRPAQRRSDWTSGSASATGATSLAAL